MLPSQRVEPRGPQSLEMPLELAALPILSEDWQAIVALGPNVLVEGPDPSTETVIRALAATIQRPLHEWGGPEPQGEAAGTLIVRRVDLLSAEEHRRLLDCLNGEDGRTRTRQVIATSAQSLYKLVESGKFESNFYYRLNTIRLELAES